MENQINFLVRTARLAAPYHMETREEIEEILKTHGCKNFIQLGDVVFAVNEHGILEGLGFDSKGEFKIWNNRNFGTFKIK